MGTKNNPGKFNCFEKAEPDEPMFVLLGRDPVAGPLLRMWCAVRGALGTLDPEQSLEAGECADQMERWAKLHGKELSVDAAKKLLTDPGPDESAQRRVWASLKLEMLRRGSQMLADIIAPKLGSSVAENEPVFILKGRDPSAPFLTSLWAEIRKLRFGPLMRASSPEIGAADREQIEEAMDTAGAMAAHAEKLGKGRLLVEVQELLAKALGKQLFGDVDGAVAALDASIQFAPKACREAMLLAKVVLTKASPGEQTKHEATIEEYIRRHQELQRERDALKLEVQSLGRLIRTTTVYVDGDVDRSINKRSPPDLEEP